MAKKESFYEEWEDYIAMSVYKIPKDIVYNFISTFWCLLKHYEATTPIKPNSFDKLLISDAYDLLNKINFTDLRPDFESDESNE
jgi:hypothetical protein